MLNDDIAALRHLDQLAHFRGGRVRVGHIPQGDTGSAGVAELWTCAPSSRAANDNQLAWPCVAFAEDWYASC